MSLSCSPVLGSYHSPFSTVLLIKIPYLHDKAMSNNSTQLLKAYYQIFVSHDLHSLDVEDPVPSLPLGMVDL